MKNRLVNVHAKLGLARHLIAAIGWIVACVFSIYILADRVITDKPYTIFHVVVPFALLLASASASRRYLFLRSKAAKDTPKVPSAGA